MRYPNDRASSLLVLSLLACAAFPACQQGPTLPSPSGASNLISPTSVQPPLPTPVTPTAAPTAPSPGTPPAVSPPVVPPPALPPGQNPAVDPDSLTDAEETEMLELINQHRADEGQAPLALSPTLTLSSRWLSRDMAAGNYMSHHDRQGRNPFTRMNEFGYDFASWRGENIACGNGGAAATYSQWLHSPGHNANMLSPHYTVIGIARAYDENSRFHWYWTTDFGSN